MTMRRGQQQNGISRLCFGMMLVLALMLRASIPGGFMPAAGKAGLTQMAICTGVAQDGESKKDSDPSHSAPCAFTLVLAHGAPAQAPAIPVPAFGVAVVSAGIVFLSDADVIKPWLSRGPPQFLA